MSKAKGNPEATLSPSRGKPKIRESNVAIQRRHRRRKSLVGGENFFQPVPAWIWLFTAMGVTWGYFTPNPILTICSISMLPVLASLLWFKGEPPVLLFACCMQWLQATTAIFYSDFQNNQLSVDMDVGRGLIEEATWLSMAGVLVAAVGMRLALVNRDNRIVEQAQQEARLIQIDGVLVLYLIAFAFSFFLGRIAFGIPQLTQPLLALGAIRWVMLFLLAYSVLVNRRQYALLGFAVGLEIVAGFTGYFSDFKSVFFILLIVLPAAGLTLRGWRLVQFVTAAILVFVLAVFWTAVKGDYRASLNQGTGQQIASLPIKQRLAILSELPKTVDIEKFKQGFEDLLLRISYVEYFALTIQNVPSNVPYEKGQLWWDSIKHVVMPRLLFPGKSVIDDSMRTSQYTGLEISGAERGTSISIGYFGESYIDFGPIGMFGPIFLLGLFHGSIYRFFTTYSQKKIIGLAIAVSILVFGACTIETSNIKILGGNVVVCLAMTGFLIVGETRLWNLISRPPRRKRDLSSADNVEPPANGRGAEKI